MSARETIRRKAVALLQSSPRPLTTREILEAVRPNWQEDQELTHRLVYNSIVDDPRFVRVAASTWTLTRRPR